MILNRHFAFICVLLFGMLFYGCSEDARLLFREYPVEDDVLRIEYDEPPAFGPHTLYLEYLGKGQGKPQSIGHFQLNNDGANLTEDNIRVEVKEAGVVHIVLHGQQQQDETLILKVEGGMAQLLSP